MSLLSTLFGKNKPDFIENYLLVDMHSHLIPGIDDGSKTMDESIELIKDLAHLGYKKIITTPHIMGDFFKNTPDTIMPGLAQLKIRLKEENIDIVVDAAAEYYLDEWLIEKLQRREKFLTFGDKYVLFETSYINEPPQLHQVIFLMRSLGYIPVLAHPERYVYLYSDFSNFQKIYEMGVLFQMNLNSLSGYYSRDAKNYAEKLIDHKMVDFVGTDCHGKRHVEALIKSRQTSHYRKLQALNLLNNSLLS